MVRFLETQGVELWYSPTERQRAMVTATKDDLIPEAFREIALIRPLDADDLRVFPDDDKRYEIIGGQLVVSPSPSTRHQHVLGEIYTALKNHLTSKTMGRVFVAPLDVRLSFYDVVQPDLLVVLDNRREIIQEQEIAGPPNLVVEVLSPSSKTTDRVDKAALYARSGVEEYWIVDPVEETVMVYGLDGDRYAPAATLERQDDLYSIVLAGLVLDLDTIFPDPSPKTPVEGERIE
jgi:Uma2 family endonuclease